MVNLVEFAKTHKAIVIAAGAVTLGGIVYTFLHKSSASGSTSSTSTSPTNGNATTAQYLIPYGNVSSDTGATGGSSDYGNWGTNNGSGSTTGGTPGGGTTIPTGSTTATTGTASSTGTAVTTPTTTTSPSSTSPTPTVPVSAPVTAIGAAQNPISGSYNVGSQAHFGYNYQTFQVSGLTEQQLALQEYPGASPANALATLQKYNPLLGGAANANTILSGNAISIPNSPNAPVINK